MKNWIIALAVLVIPMMTYYVLDKTHNANNAFEANAKNAYEKPVVIKFASPMCLDCKKLEAVMNEVMPKYEGKVIYQKVNTQNNDANTSALIKKHGVTLVPTLVFIKKDGTVHKQTEGYMTKNELESHIDALLKQ